jgi:hypothetical protein
VDWIRERFSGARWFADKGSLCASLAAALMFAYLALLLDEASRIYPLRALTSGFVAGWAFLAKAYMLPFVLTHLPVARWFLARTGPLAPYSTGPDNVTLAGGGLLRRIAWLGLGLALTAAPWVRFCPHTSASS